MYSLKILVGPFNTLLSLSLAFDSPSPQQGQKMAIDLPGTAGSVGTPVYIGVLIWRAIVMGGGTSIPI